MRALRAGRNLPRALNGVSDGGGMRIGIGGGRVQFPSEEFFEFGFGEVEGVAGGEEGGEGGVAEGVEGEEGGGGGVEGGEVGEEGVVEGEGLGEGGGGEGGGGGE